jgi:molybdopterin-biosynthesis enzyme MoeA-like protein
LGFDEGGQVIGKPGGLVEPGVTHYATDQKKIEKGIFQRDNGSYRIKANRAGVMLDKTLPKGSTLEDARKVLKNWEEANPIKVKWKEGQKIKIISEGPAGKQVATDIVYKTPEIEKAFKKALTDYAGENKGNWSKAKLNKQFGNISQDAAAFVRKQEPELIRDWDAIQTKKYRTHLDDLGIKDWASANKKQRQVIMTKAYRVVNPYERTGYSVAREQLAKNIGVLNKFEKSGQTLEYFYDIVKDRTFKKNLRAYLNGTAGEFVTEAFDEAGIKTKYKNILPKIKDHLEVWHSYENPGTAYKGQLKKAKIKKWSDLHTENMISKAKRVTKTDYNNMLDLSHRQDLVIDQNISELGIERPEINRVLIKDAEIERNKLHRKNFELVDEIKKGNNVEKNLRLINENNARITKIAELTKGRLTGITINPDTLEAVKLKPSNIMGVDAGILNKSMKDLTVADKKVLRTQILPQIIEEARAMTPQKIASDLSGIMDDPVLSEKLATRMKNLKQGKQITKPVFEQSQEVFKLMQEFCGYGKSAGGRIGFQKGSCPTKVAARNFALASEDLVQGRVTGKAGQELAEKIGTVTKVAGSRGMLTKLLGPYGVGLDVVFEAGMIGTDVLKGKPLNEAVADNWLAGSVYKTFTGKTGEKLFNERLAKMDSSTKLYGNAMNLGSEIEDLNKKLSRMEADIGTARSPLKKEDIAKIKAEIDKKTKEFNTLTKDGTLIEPGTPAYESYHSAATELRGKDRATSAYSKYLGPTVSRDLVSDRYQPRERVESTLPGNYSTFKPELPTRGDVNTVFQNLGLVHPISGKVPDWYADELINQEKWRQSMEQPGMKGTQDKFFNTGGRVPFIKGKIVKGVDEGRRAFMKWLASITGAGIAAGTGLIKWGKVAGKGKTIVKAGDHIIQGTPGMPDWFIPLVNRVVKEGDDVSKKLGTVEREIVHTKKLGEGKFADEVTVYQDMNTGNVRVEFESIHNMGEAPVQLEYRAGEVIEEGKYAGKKTNPEFEAVESEPVGHVHGEDDYTIEWDGENLVGKVDDLTSDTSRLKEYGTGKKLNIKDRLKAEQKKKEVQKIHEDSTDYISERQGEADWDDYLPDIDDID